MRRLAYVLLVGATFLGGIATGCAIDDWFDVDACLDHGGAWEYQRETCLYA
jgi:hypothetical protein